MILFVDNLERRGMNRIVPHSSAYKDAFIGIAWNKNQANKSTPAEGEVRYKEIYYDTIHVNYFETVESSF
jgi:hypothetical protein